MAFVCAWNVGPGVWPQVLWGSTPMIVMGRSVSACGALKVKVKLPLASTVALPAMFAQGFEALPYSTSTELPPALTGR